MCTYVEAVQKNCDTCVPYKLIIMHTEIIILITRVRVEYGELVKIWPPARELSRIFHSDECDKLFILCLISSL